MKQLNNLVKSSPCTLLKQWARCLVTGLRVGGGDMVVEEISSVVF